MSMTITSTNPTRTELPEEDHRAGRSDVTWAEEAYRGQPDRSLHSVRRRPPRRRSARRLTVPRAVLAVGVLSVGVLSVAATSDGSTPQRDAPGAAANRHAPAAVAKGRTHVAQPSILQPSNLQCVVVGRGTRARRLLFPLLPTVPCAVVAETGGTAHSGGAAIGMRP